MAKGRGDEVAERLIKIVIYKKPTRERLLYNSIDYTITKENKTELRKFFFCESRVWCAKSFIIPFDDGFSFSWISY